MTFRGETRSLRSDIQGLRAIAVGVVVAFHVWPGSLTGGFVGVDVFFVISGFLITTHLVNRPPHSWRDFAQFWGRRARRLLPASLLVLAVTLAATRLLAPETLWDDTARQARAATLYVVNWMLAGDAVDYLAADDAPTAVQHFWSLSVEEQFYLFWPLLIAALAWLAHRSGLRRETLWTCGLLAVAAASLAWSIHLTDADPGRAYFVTTTRVWELAVGGLVALLLVMRPAREQRGGREEAARAVLAWAGIGVIAYACVTFDAATPFPSWRAGIPVLGAAAVIAASAGNQIWSPGRFLALRPMQWLGDISYAVYLWHWPLVVILGGLVAPLGLLDAGAVVAATLLLAHLTTRYVEAPFRDRSWDLRLGATYRYAGVAMALVLAASTLQLVETERRAEAETIRVAEELAAAGACLGAGALDPRRNCPPHQGEVIPSPAQAGDDFSDAFPHQGEEQDCRSDRPQFPTLNCVFGDLDGDVHIALVGNSHAGHWLPAVQQIGDVRGWRITTHMASRCAFADTTQDIPGTDAPQNCRDWAGRTLDTLIDERPDLVVVSNRISAGIDGAEPDDSGAAYTEAFTRILDPLAAAKIPVAVIRSTPTPDVSDIGSIPDCLAAAGVDSSDCDAPLTDWLSPDVDPAEAAVAAVRAERRRALMAFVDVNDQICHDDTCTAVIGGVIGWSDGSHLTATFNRTLAAALNEDLVKTGLMPR